MTIVRPSPIQIHSGDQSQVVLNAGNNLDRFVMTQDEVIRACQTQQEIDTARNDVREQLTDVIGWIVKWCHANKVKHCLLFPRSRDIFVAMVAPDEDDEGRLHDLMCELDLRVMKETRLAFYWMMFRASEAGGVDAFADRSNSLVLIGE